MNIKHSNSVDSKMIIDKYSLDLYGDHLLIVGFRFMPVRSPFEIIKVSEKYDTGTFTGNYSLN
jgi:hypothetical protein